MVVVLSKKPIALSTETGLQDKLISAESRARYQQSIDHILINKPINMTVYWKWILFFRHLWIEKMSYFHKNLRLWIFAGHHTAFNNDKYLDTMINLGTTGWQTAKSFKKLKKTRPEDKFLDDWIEIITFQLKSKITKLPSKMSLLHTILFNWQTKKTL